MNTNSRNRTTPPSLSEFHTLLRQMAISKGLVVPETDDEFVQFEKSIDSTHLPKHDFSEVLRFIQGGYNEESKIVVFPQVDQSIVEELAQAARNGTEIPQEIKDRMACDRKLSELDRRKE